MKYSDGQIVRINDRVELWQGCIGVVVCSMDSDDYSPEYPRAEWEYLKSGVLVNSEETGLIHYLEADEDFRLLERATTR